MESYSFFGGFQSKFRRYPLKTISIPPNPCNLTEFWFVTASSSDECFSLLWLFWTKNYQHQTHIKHYSYLSKQASVMFGKKGTAKLKKTFGFVWYANCCLWCKHICSVNRVCFGFFGLANRITKEQVIILIKNCAFPVENSSCLFQIRNYRERICSYEHGSKGTKTYLPKPPVYRSWNHRYVLKKI